MLQATHQPASWPRIWSTEAEADLQDRLSRLPFYAPAGFGGIFEDLQALATKAPALVGKASAVLNKAGPHLDLILKVLDDPALPLLLQRVQTIQALQAKTAPPPVPGAGVTPAAPGVGLQQVIPIWDVAIFYKKHPWAPWAIGAGTILALGGLGFGLGRWTKRCRVSSSVGRYYQRR